MSARFVSAWAWESTVSEGVDPIEEELSLVRKSLAHAYFGGIGGYVAEATITRDAHRLLGEPESLTVRVSEGSR